jgi:hypothetical protein
MASPTWLRRSSRDSVSVIARKAGDAAVSRASTTRAATGYHLKNNQEAYEGLATSIIP